LPLKGTLKKIRAIEEISNPKNDSPNDLAYLRKFSASPTVVTCDRPNQVSPPQTSALEAYKPLLELRIQSEVENLRNSELKFCEFDKSFKNLIVNCSNKKKTINTLTPRNADPISENFITELVKNFEGAQRIFLKNKSNLSEEICSLQKILDQINLPQDKSRPEARGQFDQLQNYDFLANNHNQSMEKLYAVFDKLVDKICVYEQKLDSEISSQRTLRSVGNDPDALGSTSGRSGKIKFGDNMYIGGNLNIIHTTCQSKTRVNESGTPANNAQRPGQVWIEPTPQKLPEPVAVSRESPQSVFTSNSSKLKEGSEKNYSILREYLRNVKKRQEPTTLSGEKPLKASSQGIRLDGKVDMGLSLGSWVHQTQSPMGLSQKGSPFDRKNSMKSIFDTSNELRKPNLTGQDIKNIDTPGKSSFLKPSVFLSSPNVRNSIGSSKNWF
jgi:hypothetical protein